MPTSGQRTATPSETSAMAQVLTEGTPQLKTLLTHLIQRREDGLSQLEATHLYQIAALPRRIADLKDAGIPIVKARKLDPRGRAYVRYFLAVKP